LEASIDNGYISVMTTARHYVMLIAPSLGLLGVACGATTSTHASTSDAASPKSVDLEGDWVSEDCVGVPQSDGSILYLARAFRFSGERWELALTTHADAACSVRLMRIDVAGAYEIERPSNVRDAFEARFGRSMLQITPFSEDSAAFLGSSGCGAEKWHPERSQSVAGGCLFLPSLSDCPSEYDLVKRSGERLYFGARSGSLCTDRGRPIEIDTHAMVKR
jgi:hypothetical protein